VFSDEGTDESGALGLGGVWQAVFWEVCERVFSGGGIRATVMYQTEPTDRERM
jgi:hypothetical protein